MTNVLDPLALLATGVHTQRGVYALLLGSGVSTGAGMPTGWGVVQELVRRLATATHPDDPDAVAAAAADPEQWWQTHGDGQSLGYSNLLGALGPTPAARRALLAGFFEPNGDDAAAAVSAPSSAHRAIAQLVKRGYIRVILTTNFDRLIEKALEDVGVSPQILTRPEAVAGLTPLPHAPVTLIKLHGDYADLDMRNTLEELSTYPAQWDTQLDRILDEYGLLICGWSADWDKALVAALERAPARRYPLYWDSRSSRGSTAARLLAQHRGTVVPIESADAMFTGVLERVDALERLAEPPLTTAMAIARLKRYLPDPARRIDLQDLVAAATEGPADAARTGPMALPDGGDIGQRVQDLYANYLRATEPLLALLTAGVFYDRDRWHTDLWVDAIQRLLQARTPPDSYNEDVEAARHYPALLALRATGTLAAHLGRDDVLLRLLTEPTWRSPRDQSGERRPVNLALNEYLVASESFVNAMPRWGSSRARWHYPASHLLRADLRDVVRPYLPDDADYSRASDRYEYLHAVLTHRHTSRYDDTAALPGEFLGEQRLTRQGLQPAIDFHAEATQADSDWPWWNVMGGIENYETYLTQLNDALAKMRRRY